MYTDTRQATGNAAPREAAASPERDVLGLAFAKASHPMWIFDRETLAFLDVNDAAVEQYGYSRLEFLTMAIVDIRPPDGVTELLRQTPTPRPRGASTAEAWRHRTKQGVVVPVMITSWV